MARTAFHAGAPWRVLQDTPEPPACAGALPSRAQSLPSCAPEPTGGSSPRGPSSPCGGRQGGGAAPEAAAGAGAQPPEPASADVVRRQLKRPPSVDRLTDAKRIEGEVSGLASEIAAVRGHLDALDRRLDVQVQQDIGAMREHVLALDKKLDWQARKLDGQVQQDIGAVRAQVLALDRRLDEQAAPSGEGQQNVGAVWVQVEALERKVDCEVQQDLGALREEIRALERRSGGEAAMSEFRSDVEEWMRTNLLEVSLALRKEHEDLAQFEGRLRDLEGLSEENRLSGVEANQPVAESEREAGATIQRLSDHLALENCERKAAIVGFRAEVEEWLQRNLQEVTLALHKAGRARAASFERQSLNGVRDSASEGTEAAIAALAESMTGEDAEWRVAFSRLQSEVEERMKVKISEFSLTLRKERDTAAKERQTNAQNIAQLQGRLHDLEELKQRMAEGNGGVNGLQGDVQPRQLQAAVETLEERIAAEVAERKAEVAALRSSLEEGLRRTLQEVNLALHGQAED